VIGVSAVITMVTLGNGATQAVQTQIASLGSNLLMVMPGSASPGPAAAAGRAAVHRGRRRGHPSTDRRRGRRGAAGPRRGHRRGNGRNWATTVTGSTNAWFVTGNWKLASGRLFEPTTNSAPAPPSASSAKPCGARSSAARSVWAARRVSCASSSSRAR
jgi:putative ABC transport system permease protein